MKKILLLFCLLPLISIAQQSESYSRIYEHKKFTLINPGEIIPIYKREIFTGGKGFQTKMQYYFSKDSSAAILSLTLVNLKTVFANDPSFCEWLDIYFHNDAELLRYDNYRKIYFLNKAYGISQKNPLKTD